MKLKQGKIIVAIAEQGYTNVELAKKAGVAPNAVSNARSGRDCRLKTAMKITQALGLNLEEVVEEW